MELALEIEDTLYERLTNRAEQQGFESVEEYGTVIIETVIMELEDDTRTEAVEEHLEDLGYL